MSLCMQKVKVGCGLLQGASLWEDGAGAERGRQNTGEGDSDRPLMYTVLLEVVVVVVV